jgi:hypothetical protein
VLQRTAADGALWNSKLDTSIFNANGQQATLVAGTVGNKECLYFVADTTGVYTLTVGSTGAIDPSSGGYMLKLMANPDDYPATIQTSGLLELSKPVHGTISVGDVDWVKVHLDAGKQYAFDMHSASTALTGNSLDLLDAHGAVLTNAQSSVFLPQDAVLVYTAASTGDYYLSTHGNQPGFDYTLSEQLLTGDTTGPVLKSVSIANGATNAPVSGGIRFVFDEPVTMGAGYGAVLKDASGNPLTWGVGGPLARYGTWPAICTRAPASSPLPPARTCRPTSPAIWPRPTCWRRAPRQLPTSTISSTTTGSSSTPKPASATRSPPLATPSAAW